MLTDDLTVSSALADLAATTGDQALPLAPIEARARRLRHRRRAGRAGVVVICLAALTTGIGLAGTSEPNPSQLIAAAPPVVLPLCTALPPQVRNAQAANASGRDATAAGNARIAVPGAPPAVGEKFKAPGTVKATSAAGAVTIVVGAPLSSTPQPVTFAITADTLFYKGGQVTTPTVLRAGDKVAFVATRTDQSGYRLDLIETDMAAAAIQTKPPITSSPAGDSTKGATDKAGPPAIGQSVPGKGSIASAPASGKVGLMILAGPLAGQTIDFAITPATKFTSGGRQCDPSGVAAGTGMGFSATRIGTATYRLDELNVA
jgi:hypothetical protein